MLPLSLLNPLKRTTSFKRILVTAALPYANGDIHLGHLAGAYLPADIYVRYQRLKGCDVVFVCGSDEHGVAIMVTAEREHTTAKHVVDRYHERNKEAFDLFGMSFDNYSRTSLPLHHKTSREFFADFFRRKILKEKEEFQLYCETDRMFLADRYVEGKCPRCGYPQARGDQCENCGSWLNQTDLIDPKCKICGNSPVVKKTSQLYFPLGNYQKRLESYIEERSKRDGWKENVLRYCGSWFKEGLEDRAVTRDLPWGVPVPAEGFEKKVIYVWFDAVLGYISSTIEWAEKKGDPQRWKKYWLAEDTKYVAFIGKDNVVFHCIVFPAMLMAWNDGSKEHYVLPENVPANEFLNFEGQKFSKSRGWGIDVRDFLAKFPADPLRYTLALNLPESRDADFYLKDFQARTNNELADILGNFVNRTFVFAHRTFGGRVPPRKNLKKIDKEMVELLKTAPDRVGEHFEHYRFREGAIEAMNVARAANKYFNDSRPWKTAEEDKEACGTTINICLQTVRSLALLFAPVVPVASTSLLRMLNLQGAGQGGGWDTSGELALQDGHKLKEPEILVTKIEDTQIEEIISPLAGAAPMETQSGQGDKPRITIDDFRKMDLRVAKILEAEKVPKSEKLLRLKVEIGPETRQIIAGIAQHYEAAKLIGQTIVVVTNLEPARIMGEESQGMLLAANEGSRISILTVQHDVPSGTIVK